MSAGGVILEAVLTAGTVQQAAAAGQAIQADPAAFTASVVSALVSSNPTQFGNVSLTVTTRSFPVFLPPSATSVQPLATGAVAGIVMGVGLVLAAAAYMMLRASRNGGSSVSPSLTGHTDVDKGSAEAAARGQSPSVHHTTNALTLRTPTAAFAPTRV